MNSRKKRRLIRGMICLGILLLVAIFATAFFNRQVKKKEKGNETSQLSSSDETRVSSYSYSEPSPDEKNYREARATLERPESPVSDQQKAKVSEALKLAVEDIKNHQKNTGEVSGTVDNRLSATSSPMILTFATAINLAGYNLEESQTEVSKSFSDDVLQFICVLTKEGDENSYFVGNYNDYTGQLQIASYHGGSIRVRGD